MKNNDDKPPDSLWTDLKALPKPYWILFSGTLINRFGHFVMPFLALYLQREGYAIWVTGASLGAYGAGGLLAGISGGYCADRFGRRHTIVASCAAAAVAMILLSAAVSPTAIVVAAFVVGLTSAMYFPAASALLADLVPHRLRVRAFACQRLAVNLGFALGMMTAGLLAAHSFTMLFYIDAATTLVLGLLVWRGMPDTHKPKTSASGWLPALKAMRARPAYIRAVAASFFIATVFMQMSSSFGLQVTLGGGFDEKVYGWLMALNGLMVAFLELPLTSYTRRQSSIRIMVIGYAMVGIGMSLNLAGASLPMLVVVMLVFTFGEMIALPVAQSHIASIAPDEMRGRFMGLLGVAWSLAMMIGPAVGVALFHTSPTILWIACLVFGLAAAGCIIGTKTSESTTP